MGKTKSKVNSTAPATEIEYFMWKITVCSILKTQEEQED